MAYKRLQVAQHFGRDTETIRRWSIEFANYLSHDANSQGRNKSSYSDADMETLSLIRGMYDKGSSVEDIHVALKSGQKGQFDGFLQNARVVLSESQAIQLKEIVARNEELETLLADALKKLAASEAKNEMIPELQEEIKALSREIGKLQYQLELQGKKS